MLSERRVNQCALLLSRSGISHSTHSLGKHHQAALSGCCAVSKDTNGIRAGINQFYPLCMMGLLLVWSRSLHGTEEAGALCRDIVASVRFCRRVTKLGQDFWRSLVQTHAQSRAGWVSSISRDGDPTTPLKSRPGVWPPSQWIFFFPYSE